MLPSNAVGGSRTWLKYVSEWLIGRDPPRGGKSLERMSETLWFTDGDNTNHLMETPGVID